VNGLRPALLAGMLVLAACAEPTADFVAAEADIAAALADPARPAADRPRDATSKPAEVLSFLRLERGMRVLDLNAATGWYAEILARVVGPTGHVIAHNHPGARRLPAEEFEARYGNGRLPNVEQLFVPHNDLRLPPASLDAVLMSMVYHDTYWHSDTVDWGPIDRQALLTSLRDALRPGGIVGVVDHFAVAGADPAASVPAVHRIDVAVVERDFAAAGFELVAASDVLRNPSDDHSLSVFDDKVVGRTDRFVLRFRKPPPAER
jgi:predicted methyltransferase